MSPVLSNKISFNKDDLEKKLSKDFYSLNTLVSTAYKRHGNTAACSKAIKQYTISFYRKVALNYRFRKIREYLLSTVNKSGQECFYQLYNDSGCQAKLYAIPSASTISPKAFSSTLNSLVVDYGSVQITKKRSMVIGNSGQNRTQRFTQGESCVDVASSKTISLRATTKVAIFFCICYQYEK